MVIGSGAREHAIALSYLRNNNVSVVVAPGSAGMDGNRINKEFFHTNRLTVYNEASLKDESSILNAVRVVKPDLVDIAVENLIASGAGDVLRQEGFNVFAPTKAASQIEWDKAWAREFMSRHNIPVPDYRVFRVTEQESEMLSYGESILGRGKNVYFKESGLRGGKGVKKAANKEEMQKLISHVKSVGYKSPTVVVEEGLVGEEFSYFVISDGQNFSSFKSAQDNKRTFNRDRGELTGGMGAHSPALVTKGLEKKIEESIIAPVIKGLAEEGRPYKGILYLGGIVDKEGKVNVIEFNSRWGDPECQVILPSLYDNYLELVDKAMNNGLAGFKINQDPLTRVCIVGASFGYPDSIRKGKQIWIDHEYISDKAKVFIGGVGVENDKMVIAGGRLFSVVSADSNIINARRKALDAMGAIYVEGNNLHYRTDIGSRDVDRFLK